MKKYLAFLFLSIIWFAGKSQTLATNSLSGTLCAGSSLYVTYASSGSFNSGNTITVQLSDPMGTFSNPITIGSSALAANSIQCTIPAATVAGGAYRIRVVSSSPVVIGTDNGTNLTVNAMAPAPSISLRGSACPGGGTLVLGGVSGSSQINWYNDTSLVSTALPYQTSASASGRDSLNYPTGIFVDHSGNIFLSEQNNDRIQKLPAGSISGTNLLTVGGVTGIAGNDATHLSSPQAICLDRSGNIFVADAANNRIQEFGAGSRGGFPAATVAGGNGAGSATNQLNHPSGVCLDDSGYIYVADVQNNRVQRFPPNSTSLTVGVTVAGTMVRGSASNQLNSPTSVFVDHNRNIYVADFGNNRIQKFPAGSAYAVTVAGGNGAGAAGNQLNRPFGVFVDNAGNIYVADQFNRRIQKFATGSSQTSYAVTVADSIMPGSYQLGTPSAVYVDSLGHIYIADESHSTVSITTPGILDSTYAPISAGAYTAVYTSSAGCVSAASAPITISTTVPVTVTDIVSHSTICSTAADTFYASGTNGGTSPSYQWYKNGRPIVANNAPAYIASGLNNNDSVWVVMSSNLNCASPATATAGAIHISVTPAVTPAVSIAASATTVCPSTNVSFTASAVNAGSLPTFEWYKNGNPVGPNAPTYQTNSLNNNDSVWAVVTSSAACTTVPSAVSGSVHMNVSGQITPLVTVTPSNPAPCPSQLVTFTAAGSGGGTAPTYQWFKSGVSVGTNSLTFSTNTINANDSVWVVMTSNATCAATTTATAPKVYMTLTPQVVPSVTVSASRTALCSADLDSFAAAPVYGGTSPSYQWYKNGIPTGVNSPTYISTTQNNNDSVWVVMTSNATCASSSFATAGKIRLAVTPSVTPVISVVASNNSVLCIGAIDTFTATASNGGSSPLYAWYKNGVIEAVSTPVYMTNALNTGDSIWATVTTNAACATVNTAVSNAVTVTVYNRPNPNITLLGIDTLVTGSYTDYQWFRNDTSINYNTQFIIAAPEADSYRVLVTDAHGCADTSAAVSVQSFPSGISTVYQAGIKLYPNPNSGSFILETINEVGQDYTITDMLGRSVAAGTVVSDHMSIEKTDLAAGAYILTMRNAPAKAIRFTVRP